MVDYVADQIAFYVVGHDRRAHQVWTATSGRVDAVTKSAGLAEQFAASFYGGVGSVSGGIVYLRSRGSWCLSRNLGAG